MRKLPWVLVALCALAVACGGSGSSRQSAHSSAFAAFDHQPGLMDVSTVAKGKPFYATPNFHYYANCGRPCWLPINPRPILQPGHQLTKGWPCEFYVPNKPHTDDTSCTGKSAHGDTILVRCQVRSANHQLGVGAARNDAGQVSTIWDAVVIPNLRVVNSQGHGQTPLFYANDIWLGNTGWHAIPCHSPTGP